MHVHVEHNVLQNAGKHLINTAVADVLFGLVISGCVFMVEPFFEVRLWPKHATNSLEWFWGPGCTVVGRLTLQDEGWKCNK